MGLKYCLENIKILLSYIITFFSTYYSPTEVLYLFIYFIYVNLIFIIFILIEFIFACYNLMFVYLFILWHFYTFCQTFPRNP